MLSFRYRLVESFKREIEIVSKKDYETFTAKENEIPKAIKEHYEFINEILNVTHLTPLQKSRIVTGRLLEIKESNDEVVKKTSLYANIDELIGISEENKLDVKAKNDALAIHKIHSNKPKQEFNFLPTESIKENTVKLIKDVKDEHTKNNIAMSLERQKQVEILETVLLDKPSKSDNVNNVDSLDKLTKNVTDEVLNKEIEIRLNGIIEAIKDYESVVYLSDDPDNNNEINPEKTLKILNDQLKFRQELISEAMGLIQFAKRSNIKLNAKLYYIFDTHLGMFKELMKHKELKNNSIAEAMRLIQFARNFDIKLDEEKVYKILTERVSILDQQNQELTKKRKRKLEEDIREAQTKAQIKKLIEEEAEAAAKYQQYHETEKQRIAKLSSPFSTVNKELHEGSSPYSTVNTELHEGYDDYHIDSEIASEIVSEVRSNIIGTGAWLNVKKLIQEEYDNSRVSKLMNTVGNWMSYIPFVPTSAVASKPENSSLYKAADKAIGNTEGNRLDPASEKKAWASFNWYVNVTREIKQLYNKAKINPISSPAKDDIHAQIEKEKETKIEIISRANENYEGPPSVKATKGIYSSGLILQTPKQLIESINAIHNEIKNLLQKDEYKGKKLTFKDAQHRNETKERLVKSLERVKDELEKELAVKQGDLNSIKLQSSSSILITLSEYKEKNDKEEELSAYYEKNERENENKIVVTANPSKRRLDVLKTLNRPEKTSSVPPEAFYTKVVRDIGSRPNEKKLKPVAPWIYQPADETTGLNSVKEEELKNALLKIKDEPRRNSLMKNMLFQKREHNTTRKEKSKATQNAMNEHNLMIGSPPRLTKR